LEHPLKIGRFTVIRRLGAGGMGVVYVAYDEQLDRRVAVKMLQQSVSEIARARVEREARAMAKLTHANVVQVYEVGRVSDADDERLFIAMEYVDGSSLQAWQAQEDRTWTEVLQAYRQAGEGLAAAHHVGLVHRDFKPANAMVSTTPSGQPLVKVLDFGLALEHDVPEPAVDQPTVSRSNESWSGTRLTADGSVMGTPAYMAPEQFVSSTVGEAADQFSFCVALWEGLFGQRPFRGRSLQELAAAVTQGKRRARPEGSDVPQWVERALNRGLSGSPDERWPSMRELLDALEPASREDASSRRWVVGVAALAVAALGVAAVAGGGGQRCSGAEDHLAGVWDPQRQAATQAAFEATDVRYAGQAWSRAAGALDVYSEQWREMYVDACEATVVRHEQSEAVLDLRMACLQRNLQSFDATVKVLMTADREVVSRAHEVLGALEPVSACADVERLKADVEPPRAEEANAVNEARTLLVEAHVQMLAARFEEAKAAIDAAAGLLSDVTYEPALAELAYRRARLHSHHAEHDAAVRELERVLELGARSRRWDLVADALASLVFVVGLRQNDSDAALRYVPLARALANDPESEARLANSIATVWADLGRYDDAEAEYRRAIDLATNVQGPEHPSVQALRHNLAETLDRSGRLEEAETEYRRVLASVTRALGKDHPNVAMTQAMLGNVLMKQGRYEEAETVFRSALEIGQDAYGPVHQFVGEAKGGLGLIYFRTSRYDEAERLLRAAIEVQETVLGPNHPDSLRQRTSLASVLFARGELDEAEAEHRRVLAAKESMLPAGHPSVGNSHQNLANVLWNLERYEEAEAEFKAALKIWEGSLDPDHPNNATARTNLAKMFLELDRPHDALPYAEAAWERRQADDVPAEWRGDAAFALARSLWQTGDDRARRRRARALAEQARAEYESVGELRAPEVEDVRTWLRTHTVAPAAKGPN
jgi:tetratricopeptide (TPR) repeat protein/tRNA A-37 threonylcarbamoyl transferase component Bud32